MFTTSLNGRKGDDLDWDSIKGSLIEEYLKRKEKMRSPNVVEAIYTRGNHEHGPCFKCGGHGHIVRNCNTNYTTYNNNMRNNTYRSYARDLNRPGDGQEHMVILHHPPIHEGNFQRQYDTRSDVQTHGNYVSPRNEGNFVNLFNQFSVNDEIALVTNNYNSAAAHEWFIESAASQHMKFNKKALIDFIPYKKATEIFVGDNAVILGEGTVKLPLFNDNSEVTCL